MPSILVLEQDPRSLERIHQTLGGAGWRVRVVGEPAQAFQAATSERPDLVIVGAGVNGAESVAGSFSRRTGGPGVLGLLPPGTSPAGFGRLAADELLAHPFSDQELLAAVHRAGTAPRAPAAPPRTRLESKLTSQDIFGDVLAEVELAESDEAAGETAAAEQPSRPVPSPAVAATARPTPPRPSMDDDLNRKLEQTLSGVLGSDLGRARPPVSVSNPPAPPPPARPAAALAPPKPAPPRAPAPPRSAAGQATDDDIDAILSRTLGSLEMGPRPRPAAPAAPRPAAAAGPPPVSATAPPSEGTAVRRAPRPLDAGLQLEELTRTMRMPTAPSAPPPRRPVAPEPPRPAVPVASPPAPPAPAAIPEPVPPLVSAATPIFDVEPLEVSDLPGAFEAPPPAPDSSPGLLFGPDPFDLADLEMPPPAELSEPDLEPLSDLVAEAEPESAFDESSFELVDLEIEPEPEPVPEPAQPLAAGSDGSIRSDGSVRSGLEEEPLPQVVQEPLPAPTGAGVLGGGSTDFAATQRIPVMVDDGTLNVPGAERFGQYTLLEKIAAGGMAEVWKARMRGVEGFQKTVAIKKIHPHMTDNSEFIGMFIDEAKLAAQLSHPNIVHIYDLGKIGRDYYIAMEYVEGKDLRSLLNAARRKGMPLSLGLALLIASRLASALDYAHRKRDFEGKELALVHRDVSPQNVLLTREGDVKLCDFGIAKAVSKAGQTQMGALKGKLQYMSPEQAWGRPVDSRSDIFSLGAVLFEMLTGERLFSGDSEMSILEAVRHGRIRTPRDVDPTLPAEVGDIVTRALSYDVRDRFQSAGEMMQRIEAVLHTLVPSPGPGDLAAYLERVTAPEPSSDVLFIPPPPAPAAPSRLPDPEVPPSLFAPELAPVPFETAEALPVFEAVAPLGDVHVEETGGRRSRLFLVIAIIVLLAAGIVGFFFLKGRRGGEATPPAVTGPATQPAPVAPAPAQPGGPAAEPSPAQEAPSPSVDVEAILKEELAKREKERRRKYEAEVQQLERELAKARKDAQDKAAQPPPSQEPPPRPEQD